MNNENLYENEYQQNNMDYEPQTANREPYDPKPQNEEKYADENPTNVSQSSLGLGINKMTNGENFNKREAEYTQKLGEFIDKASGQQLSSKAEKLTFLVNKFLFCTSIFCLFLDRCDFLGIFCVMGVFFTNIGLCNKKYLYKWFLLLFLSLVLDAFSALDILRYILNDTSYQVGSAGATSTKFGMMVSLCSMALKIFEIFGLWKMAIAYKKGGADDFQGDGILEAQKEENYI